MMENTAGKKQRGRPPKKPTVKPKPNVIRKLCQCCHKERPIGANFYVSNNRYESDGRASVCKDCLKKDINYNEIQTVKDVLLTLNRPFLSDVWLATEEECKRDGSADFFGIYLKNIQLNNKDAGWNDGEKEDGVEIIPEKKSNENTETDEKENEPVVNGNDLKNKEDVINLIGYDPFISENDKDKPNLYNKLIDFLDEGTLEDSFKLPTVIVIVKTFNQIDMLDNTISFLMSSKSEVAKNAAQINTLMKTKKDMLASVLSLAKDNGISANHNNNKSKGAGTLSGIIKQLHEKKINSAEINIFDVETSQGMKQVADISNRSILEQLMLNENDYSEMIKDQKELIVSLRNSCSRLEEENRLIKIKLKEYEG